MILFSLHGCAVSYAASCKARHSVICKNKAAWAGIPEQGLTESPCLVIAESLTLNWWKIFLHNRCQALHRGLVSDPGLQDWLGKFFMSNQDTQRQLYFPQTAPSHAPTPRDTLVAEDGHIECHNHNFLQQFPQKDHFWRTSLGCEKASWLFIWQRTCGSSQGESEVTVLCSTSYTPT